MAWTTPRTWVTDELVTAAIMNAHVRDNFNSIMHLLVRKTADESVASSTTLQNDDALLFAIAANEVWYFKMVLVWSAGLGFDMHWSFTWPSGGTGTVTTIYVTEGNTDPAIISQVTSGTTQSLDAVTITNNITTFEGIVANGSTAGNVQFQWAQGFSSATATTVRTNSLIWGAKVA